MGMQMLGSKGRAMPQSSPPSLVVSSKIFSCTAPGPSPSPHVPHDTWGARDAIFFWNRTSRAAIHSPIGALSGTQGPWGVCCVLPKGVILALALTAQRRRGMQTVLLALDAHAHPRARLSALPHHLHIWMRRHATVKSHRRALLESRASGSP